MGALIERAAARGLSETDVKAIRERKPFKNSHIRGYFTKGGTYMIASQSKWNDDDLPRDLLAVLPGDLGSGQVIQVWIAVNPEFVDVVRRIVTGLDS